MIISHTISSGIQTPFHGPSNSLTSSHSRHLSFHFSTTHLVKPIITIRKPPNPPPKAATINGLYMASPEETLYDLLGISQSGTLSDIKRAYKQMALKYHPDVSPPEQAVEYTMKFIRVQEAYETLSDPDARAMYDSSMAKGLHLVFSGKKGCRFDPRSEEKARWKTAWQGQVSELKRRSMNPVRAEQGGRVSWAARIRKQRNGSDQEQ